MDAARQHHNEMRSSARELGEHHAVCVFVLCSFVFQRGPSLGVGAKLVQLVRPLPGAQVVCSITFAAASGAPAAHRQ